MSSPHVLEVAELVWRQRKLFVCWPERALVFIPGRTRQKYHKYTEQEKAAVRAAGIRLDARSNGPAIMAYLLAGGERRPRTGSRHQWSVHHLYDGKFVAPGRTTTLRAVTDGRYFTASAGLVAVHPVADALADEVPLFAWRLRKEAYDRFGFDPDEVFGM